MQRIEDLARGKKLAPSCEAFSAPGARADRGSRPEKPITGTGMTSPYLDRPLLPLTVALPLLLESIEAVLANGKLEAGDERRICRRAELIRWLLACRRVT